MDDNLDHLTLTRIYLESEDSSFVIDEAHDGLAALELVKVLRFPLNERFLHVLVEHRHQAAIVS